VADTSPRFRISELSERFGLSYRGDGDHEISGVGTLGAAGPQDVSHLSNRNYLKQAATTQAGVVVLRSEDADSCSVNCILSDDPYVSYARIASLFDYRKPHSPGIHSSAVIHEDTVIGEEVYIGPNVVIDAGTRIGNRCQIGPNTVIGRDNEIGDGGVVGANVTLTERVRLGRRVIVHPGVVIGSDGFGLAFAGDHWEKVPQLGGVLIGDDCEIGANSSIDRGAIEDTVLEDDVRLDNFVHIAHNVNVGAHTAIAACTGIAGTTKVGKGCLIGGGCGILGHLEIADRVTISSMSTVVRSITEAGSSWAGFVPVAPAGQWRRIISHWRKLDDYLNRIRHLEQKYREENDHE
jgi:UDP-3-O-[3-hydroxymyristoyl] glucosamine N-acyltransferase